MNNSQLILLTILILNMPPTFSLRLDADEKKVIAIAWDLAPISKQATKINGRYVTSSDNCFQKYRELLRQKNVKEFGSAEAAEKAGFIRKPIGWFEEKTYADVCSPLYEYIWSSDSKCEVIFFDTTNEAESKGYSPIASSKRNLLEASVVGIERSKVYLTPCDSEYSCLIGTESTQSNECNKLKSTTGKVRIFATENEARQAGFISQQEFYLSELDSNF
jgi:hypothetical protein